MLSGEPYTDKRADFHDLNGSKAFYSLMMERMESFKPGARPRFTATQIDVTKTCTTNPKRLPKFVHV
eukprot:176958-Amphidinium_carterae.1